MCNQHKNALQPAHPSEAKINQPFGDLPCQRCVPVYPLRYGITDQSYSATLLPTLGTAGYPALKGGKAYGLRVLRPGSYVYLFYFKDGRMWTQHYLVTPDACFAPLWWTDKDYDSDAPGRWARPHVAGAKPYLPAPETAVADTVYLMVSDTVLTHCTLWKIETNADGLRDKVAVKVQPAGGTEQAHAFNAMLLGNAAPETVQPGISGQKRFPWSECQPELRMDANAIANNLYITLRPRVDIVPLAVVLPDAIGIVSELNHLATTAVQAKARYAAGSAHKLHSARLVSGYFQHAKAHTPEETETLDRRKALVDLAGAQAFPDQYKKQYDTFDTPIAQAVADVIAWVKLINATDLLGRPLQCFDLAESGNARDYEETVFACIGALVHSDEGRRTLGKLIDAPVSVSPYWKALAGGNATLLSRLKDKTLDIVKAVFDVADKYSEEHAATPATNAMVALLQGHAVDLPERTATLYTRRLRHVMEIRFNATLVQHEVDLAQLQRFALELQGWQALDPAVLARWGLAPASVLEIQVTQRYALYEYVPIGTTTYRTMATPATPSTQAPSALPSGRQPRPLEGNPLKRMWERMRGPGGYLFTGVGGWLAVVGLKDAFKAYDKDNKFVSKSAIAGSIIVLAGASVEIGAAAVAYHATRQGRVAHALAAKVFGAKIGTALLGSLGAGLLATVDGIRAVNADHDANPEQALMYWGSAASGAVLTLATAAGGTATAATLSGGGAAVAMLGLTPVGWAVIGLIALGAGTVFVLGADNARHGPIEIWLKHSVWGVHNKHYTLNEELEAYHSLLYRPRLSAQWEEGAYDIGTLTIQCMLPSSMNGERFAHALRVSLDGKALGAVHGPIMYATGTSPVDYDRQCLIARHGAGGVVGADRGWTITMHEDAVVDLEYLYQPAPDEQPELGFTQPGFPQPLRIISGGWLSDPLDEKSVAPVRAPQ